MLKAAHKNHFLINGFSCKHISILENLGARSIDANEALHLNLKYGSQSITGIWFPYSIDYGQVRVDNPAMQIRYLSPKGSKSRAWKPAAAVITEGWKDAAAATLMGAIETGAIPGICHYQLLPQNSQQVIIFDADGWTNPDIFTQLIKAGIWVNGKIQLVPKINGNSKAGLLDWLRHLKLSRCRGSSGEDALQQAYQTLIQQSQTPANFLATLPIRGGWGEISQENKSKCIAQAIKLSWLFSVSNGALIQNITSIDQDLTSQLLSNLQRPDNLAKRQSTRPRQRFYRDVYVPIEKCLCRDNQEFINDGADSLSETLRRRGNNPKLFRLATDLLGVASALDSICQGYQGEPEVIFWNCAKRSGLSGAEIQGIWKSASSKVRMPAVPIAKILDRISYWSFTQN
jgi:hypothetical protein